MRRLGFTWEFDCHMYYRRAKLLALNLGSVARWKDKLIARLELGEVQPKASRAET